MNVSLWRWWHSVSLLVIFVGVLLIGLLAPAGMRLWAWLATLFLLTIFVLLAGHGVTGMWRGVLIDDRNKISLSRLQMVVWTMIVLSAILTATLSNVSSAQADPLALAIPPELWLLMGISTTSLVGSPLIRTNKENKPDAPRETAATFNLMFSQGRKVSSMDTRGTIIVNDSPRMASWSDLFQGEETGNGAQMDLGKVQMFYFSAILVLAYAAAVGTLFATDMAAIGSLPVLDNSMIALLGISHAGYLSSKAVPHSDNG